MWAILFKNNVEGILREFRYGSFDFWMHQIQVKFENNTGVSVQFVTSIRKTDRQEIDYQTEHVKNEIAY